MSPDIPEWIFYVLDHLIFLLVAVFVWKCQNLVIIPKFRVSKKSLCMVTIHEKNPIFPKFSESFHNLSGVISRCFHIEIDVKNTQKVSKHRYFDIESPWKDFEKFEKKSKKSRFFGLPRGRSGTPCRPLAGEAMGYKIVHRETTKGRTIILNPNSESWDLVLFE